mmetsp:Transcript_7677/g.16992  ORF Transcript_7677/g.16992 Transcript_7677/m.16992 type:complete len:219 (+) Transcript_7677:70-726(+)
MGQGMASHPIFRQLLDKLSVNEYWRHRYPEIGSGPRPDLWAVIRRRKGRLGERDPGGDVMYQLLWHKFKHKTGSWPKEEKYYEGARLGEYAKPPVLEENKLGGLPLATLPFSESEDVLALIAQARGASARARHAATYAVNTTAQAKQFYSLARAKLRMVFPEPITYVAPTANVFPMYSAAMGEHLAFLLSVPSATRGGARMSEVPHWCAAISMRIDFL